MPELTRYGFRDAISGFFEFPTENARRVLPRGFEPVEVHHGTSILAVTVFDFNESEVGEYGAAYRLIAEGAIDPGHFITGAAPLEEVLVTGSRIAAPNITSTSPVQVVTSKEIQQSGHTDAVTQQLLQ